MSYQMPDLVGVELRLAEAEMDRIELRELELSLLLDADR